VFGKEVEIYISTSFFGARIPR